MSDTCSCPDCSCLAATYLGDICHACLNGSHAVREGVCELCGQPMPEGEEMFKYHGYSGPCPNPSRLQR